MINLSNFQWSVLIGSILGDSHIGIDSKGINARLNFAHSLNQEEYFNNKYDLFKIFNGTKRYKENLDKRTNKIYKCISYTSSCNRILTELHNRFYKNSIKIIPKDINIDFNEISLSYLFMDDGSHHKNGYYLSLCNFTRDELEDFSEFLNDKFNLKCSIHSQKQLYIWKESVKNFNNMVEPYLINCMKYKLLRS